jgi:hypothetical protein
VFVHSWLGFMFGCVGVGEGLFVYGGVILN